MIRQFRSQHHRQCHNQKTHMTVQKRNILQDRSFRLLRYCHLPQNRVLTFFLYEDYQTEYLNRSRDRPFSKDFRQDRKHPGMQTHNHRVLPFLHQHHRVSHIFRRIQSRAYLRPFRHMRLQHHQQVCHLFCSDLQHQILLWNTNRNLLRLYSAHCSRIP